LDKLYQISGSICQIFRSPPRTNSAYFWQDVERNCMEQPNFYFDSNFSRVPNSESLWRQLNKTDWKTFKFHCTKNKMDSFFTSKVQLSNGFPNFPLAVSNLLKLILHWWQTNAIWSGLLSVHKRSEKKL
jgi:hypothetical protein